MGFGRLAHLRGLLPQRGTQPPGRWLPDHGEGRAGRRLPVDRVYNNDGYFQENKCNAYSVNNISGTPNPDGSFTVHFGGDRKSTNFLPIMEGWNYTVRLYRPRKELLDGRWTFPSIEPVP